MSEDALYKRFRRRVGPAERPYELPIPATPYRALLLSDMHLSVGPGRFGPGFDDEAFDFMEALAKDYDQLYILGDLFHAEDLDEQQALQDVVLARLASFETPVIVLGGNHDRMLYGRYDPLRGGAHITPADMIRVYVGPEEGGMPQQSAFLTHDGSNNYKIISEDEVIPFMRAIKDANDIHWMSWIVGGHTHHPAYNPGLRIAALGPFRREGDRKETSPPGYSYAVLSAESEEAIDVQLFTEQYPG